MTSELQTYLAAVPHELVQALEKEYSQLESRFARHDWGPGQLNGGRFAEAVLRYLEWKQAGSYTAIGQQLNRTRAVNVISADTSLPEALRFHVRRCAELLLDVRNKRDVAHLGTSIDVKEMDSRLVLRLASWSLAEIIREEAGVRAEEVQRVVDRLSAREVPLVEEIDGEIVVLATDLSATQRAMLVLYHTYPRRFGMRELQRSVKYKHVTEFRRLMEQQERVARVHVSDDGIVLTRKGLAWVETNIEMRLEI